MLDKSKEELVDMFKRNWDIKTQIMRDCMDLIFKVKNIDKQELEKADIGVEDIDKIVTKFLDSVLSDFEFSSTVKKARKK